MKPAFHKSVFLILATASTGLAAPTTTRIHGGGDDECTRSASVPIDAIQWTACAGYNETQAQCADYPVPISYDNPSLGNITLGIIRANSLSGGASPPLGSIFLNPGGPGGSGIGLVKRLLRSGEGSSYYKLLEQYNVIGVDPRGVGKSAAIKCDPALFNQRSDSIVRSEEEYNTFTKHWKAVGESCRKLTGPLLDHVDTINVVKDFDRVLLAMGEAKFNMLGLSYGTQIGYTYAEQFPCRTGRLVLDGVLDHTQEGIDTVQTESLTLEKSLQQFFKWCDQNGTKVEDSSCAIRRQGASSAESFFTDLVAKVAAKPIPAPGCTQTEANPCKFDVSLEEFMNSVQAGIAGGVSIWPEIADGLVAASQGNATDFSATYYLGETGFDYASMAVGCQDWKRVKSYAELKSAENAFNSLTPITMGYTQGLTYFARCALWPARLSNPQRRLHPSIHKAPSTILFANAFWDPETSVQWANSMRRQVEQSTLILRNGNGHTSYGRRGDIAKAMSTFLLTGELPKDGTVYQS